MAVVCEPRLPVAVFNRVNQYGTDRITVTIDRLIFMNLPEFKDVLAARDRLAGVANRTPLLKCSYLDDLLDAKVYFKPECLQQTGSFNFRGAFNTISAHGEDARERGVIACSSGNHAQGMAEAGRLLKVNVTIVMPDNAPEIKLQRTVRSGAKVVPYDREREDREAITAELADKTGAILVHPFENSTVIAGQGTAGLELAEDMIAGDVLPDIVLVPTGGGGLLAGSTLSVKEKFPAAEIHPVEPEGFDDYRRSLELGRRVSNEKAGGSVCDAILTPKPGEISFAINQHVVSGGLVVSDEEALHAVAFAFFELKCTVEPGAAVGLAALLSGKVDCAGKTVAVVLSGGNIDPEVLQKALSGYGSK